MSDRDGPPPRFIHSLQAGVALMHGGAGCDCAGTANPAIRRIVCSTVLSPGFGVYPTPELFSKFLGARGARLIENDHWRRIRTEGGERFDEVGHFFVAGADGDCWNSSAEAEHSTGNGTIEDRRFEVRAAGGRASARLQPPGSERKNLDTSVDHGSEGGDACLLPVGRLVTVLQNAARGARRPGE